MKVNFEKKLVLLTLFISGFCGISHEVLYSRILGNIIGNHFALNAAVLIMFLSGIGLGTKIAHRFSGWLWAAEAGIGLYTILFALSVPLLHPLFYGLLPTGNIAYHMAAAGILLAPPTLLIGVSLPLFAELFKHYSSGKVFDLSYMLYNFGAALTAFSIEFFLLRKMGIQNSVIFVSSLNLLTGLILFLFFRDKRVVYKVEESNEANPEKNHVYLKRTALALGILSMGAAVFQLLMLKFAEFVFGPFHETFAMVVSISILGIALGSLVSRLTGWSFQFFALAAALFLVVLLFIFTPLLGLYAEYHAVFKPEHRIFWRMGILLLMMGIPAVCIGASLPALLRQEKNVAREAGHLIFISSLANAAGYLAMILVIHRNLTYGWILLLVAGCFCLSAYIMLHKNKQETRFAAPLIWLLCLLPLFTVWNEQSLFLGYLSFENGETFERKLRTVRHGKQYRAYEDVFSIVQIGSSKYFFINGYISIPLNSSSEHTVGVIASLFTSTKDQALVLGLGSGATAGATSFFFKHTDVVEINPIVIERQPEMKQYSFDIMSRKNVKVVCDDGIRFLRNGKKKYDLILNTVTSPLYFSSGKLYTQDFFQDVKARLKPGGLYTTWIDSRVGTRGLDIILNTLAAEFPYCRTTLIKSAYFLLLCSESKPRLRNEERVMNNPRLKKVFMGRHGRDFPLLRNAMIATDAFKPRRKSPLNTLDQPELEFEMSRLSGYSNIKRYRKYLWNSINPGAYNREVFVEKPWDPLDAALFYIQQDTESSFTENFIEWGRKNVPDFDRRLELKLLRRFSQALKKYPGKDNCYEFADWFEPIRTTGRPPELLRKEIRNFPQTFCAYYRPGFMYFKHEDYASSEIFFKAASALKPKNSRAYYWIGRSLLEQKKYSAATAALKQCLKLKDDYNNANYFLGRIQAELGHKKQARAYFKAELEIDPDDKDAQTEMMQNQ